MMMEEKIRLGISRCLLGDNVRWNGGHTIDHFLVETLGQFVEYVPVCPEVEIGLSVPREPLRLVGSPESPRLMTQKTGIDMTGRMLTWARKRLKELEKENLCGYIFKTKSPSSGMQRIKVYNEKGGAVRSGVGIFARAFMDHFPHLPVEDEGRLHDVGLRENFIVRVFTYYRWRSAIEAAPAAATVVAFHTRNKLLFMAHHPEIARQLGKLTANTRALPLEKFLSTYQTLMMNCLEYKSTTRKNANVLYHMLGFFKKQLEAEEKQELVEIIEHYRLEFVPLVVPLTLFTHYVRKYQQPYLKDQYYLNPHPLELKLRNHA